MSDVNASLPGMSLDAKVLQNVDYALKFEWLVTNGLGGYASSTPLNVNTRKYHGLLVASLNPPVNRHVMLSKLDEEIQVGNETQKLGINEFRDTFYPKSHGLLKEFSLNPFPVFKYEAKGVTLRKTVVMPTGENVTVVIYDIQNANTSPAIVRIFPLINFRHFYYTTHKAQINWTPSQKLKEKAAIFQFPPSPRILLLSVDGGKYVPGQGYWIENMYLRVDAARKEDCLDDCFSPGNFEIQVKPEDHARFSITATLSENEEKANEVLRKLNERDVLSEELKRRDSLLTAFQKQHSDAKLDDWLKWLVLATDQFVVERLSSKAESVIAGYHWFEDWGRDTLISLPGLTLTTGRFNDARKILSTFNKYCNQGLVPNRFPDREADKPWYNTVDASLWFFNAVHAYTNYTGDFKYVRNELWETMQSIVLYHEKGTLNNIHMDNDGLIAHGAQLTWMDALINDTPVTGRAGKAVEIQALWYNALRIMRQFAKRFDETSLEQKYAEMAEKAKGSFLAKFWNPQGNCLYDVILVNEKDASLRPNQILAVSLGFSMLDQAESEAVVSLVHKEFWCEYGLRTLSASDPRYLGKYEGDWAQRNRAYHNGAVWPWLLGPFITAFLKVNNHQPRWREYALQKFVLPFLQNTLHHDGLGTINEVYDGDEPHLPGGCIAQAWSVAEPLHALVEDVMFLRPPFEGKVDLK